jgi:hypothetical protein
MFVRPSSGQVYSDIPGECSVTEDPPGTHTATCTALLDHFSYYAIVAPAESQGIPTVSEWGAVAMALLMLTAGTLVCLGKKRAEVV